MKKKIILASITAVLIVGVGAALSLGLFAADPEEVDLESAVQSLQQQQSSSSQEAEGKEFSLAGQWSIAANESTFAGYRAESFVSLNTAVGRTPNVEGSLTAATDSITVVEATVDMTTLKSNSSARDSKLAKKGLEFEKFPTSKFILTSPIAIDTIPAENVSINFSASGDLTVRGITLPQVLELEATIVGDKLLIVGSTDISLEDYGASISGTTEAVMEFSLVFQK